MFESARVNVSIPRLYKAQQGNGGYQAATSLQLTSYDGSSAQVTLNDGRERGFSYYCALEIRGNRLGPNGHCRGLVRSGVVVIALSSLPRSA